MAQLKTEAPVFREDEDLAARVGRLAGFSARLRQELDYVLSHLGAGNINGAGLALTVADSGGEPLGSMGIVGGGVGLAAGKTVVTARDGGAVLGCGNTVLQVTENGVRLSADGGETWRSL